MYVKDGTSVVDCILKKKHAHRGNIVNKFRMIHPIKEIINQAKNTFSINWCELYKTAISKRQRPASTII